MTDQQQPPNNVDEKKYWLDDKKNVDKIWYGLIAICGLTVLGDAFYQTHRLSRRGLCLGHVWLVRVNRMHFPSSVGQNFAQNRNAQ